MKTMSIEQIGKGAGTHLLLALLSAAVVLLGTMPVIGQARIGTNLLPTLTGSPALTVEAPLTKKVVATFQAMAVGMQGLQMPRGMAFRTGIAARPIPALSLGIGWAWSREKLRTDNPETLLRLRHTQGMALTAGWRFRLSPRLALEANAGIGKYRVGEAERVAIPGYTNDAATRTSEVTSNRGEAHPTHLAFGNGYGLSGGITLNWTIPQME